MSKITNVIYSGPKCIRVYVLFPTYFYQKRNWTYSQWLYETVWSLVTEMAQRRHLRSAAGHQLVVPSQLM